MKSYIKSAESFGTTFYRITEDQLKDFYDTNKNVVLRYIVEKLGFNAFTIDNMWGSYYDEADDTFYYCKTDGKEIIVDGEEVDPEFALEEFGPEDLGEYIQDGTDTEIKSFFTEYELSDNIDINDIAYDLISDGYDFTQVLEEMNKLDLLDNLL